jgi:hypothetical protein
MSRRKHGDDLTNPAKRLVRAAVDRTVDYVSARHSLAEKTSPAVKIGLRQLQATYRSAVERGESLPSTWDTGFRVFSEQDEDGLILFLLSVVGTRAQRFVDIGAGDGVHASNCANLAFNLGFDGLFVDANAESIARGRRLYGGHPDTRGNPPRFVEAFVKAGTVDGLVREAGFEDEIDLLSIDIDGNDYWIWQAIDCVSPGIVVIETHTEYGLAEVLAPYDEDYVWHRAPPNSPIGASPASMTKLAETLGYRLVGANRFGFNAVYLRNDLAPDLVPSIEVGELLRHDRNRRRYGAASSIGGIAQAGAMRNAAEGAQED